MKNLPGAVFQRMWSFNPVWGAVTSMSLGLMIVLLSVPMKVAFVSYDLGGGVAKQVGFIPSLSWSVSLVFLFPAAIFAALQTVRVLRRTFLSLPKDRMLVGGDWSRVDAREAEDFLDGLWRAAAPVGLLFFLVAVMVGVWDFFTVVAQPLLSGRLPVAPGDADLMRELDWSVAALFGPISDAPLPGVAANLTFSALAYFLLVAQVAFLLSFFGMLVGLSAVIYQLAEGEGAVQLVPDATSSDRRRGFQIFARFFQGVLSVALFAYIACYLMRIQNLFLRDPDVRRVDQFMFNDIAENLSEVFRLPDNLEDGIGYVFDSVGDVATAVFATGDLADTQAYMGVGMLLIGVLLVVLALLAILRSAADESRQVVLRELEDPALQPRITAFYGTPAAVITERLESAGMDEWPLKWPKLNAFLAYITFGFACFFFFRLALVWIAIQLWYLLRQWPKD